MKVEPNTNCIDDMVQNCLINISNQRYFNIYSAQTDEVSSHLLETEILIKIIFIFLRYKIEMLPCYGGGGGLCCDEVESEEENVEMNV